MSNISYSGGEEKGVLLPTYLSGDDEIEIPLDIHHTFDKINTAGQKPFPFAIILVIDSLSAKFTIHTP